MHSTTPETPAKPSRPLVTPPIDIRASDEGLVLEADLPGVRPEGLDIQVQENVLTIHGRPEPCAAPDSEAVYQEFQLGEFVRSFILSDEVDQERIRARLADGVLRLELPKAERAQPRKIRVKPE